MQTTLNTSVDQEPHPLDRDLGHDSSPAISLSHYVLVLRRYRRVILLLLAAVLLAYSIFALLLYLLAPGQTTTSQSFRLEFDGAGEGLYPNGTRFNIADVISGPIVSQVYRDNDLERMISPGDFSRSLFVLESNPQYDALAAQYHAQLADPRLSSVDRERLQRDFEMKRLSIAKNEYALHFTRPLGTRKIPLETVRKVLLEVLNKWASFEVHQQRVLEYQVSVLSPKILTPSEVEKADLVAALEALRSKANRVVANLGRIASLPGANLAHLEDGVSLEEIRLRVENLIRYRIEPLLTATVHSNRASADRSATIRFIETQLAYDQRVLDGALRKAEAVRDALAAYERTATDRSTPAVEEGPRAAQPQSKLTPPSGDAVMPQLSETFLDRLMTITGRAGDSEYRQNRVLEYQAAIEATIPPQHAVAFHNQLLLSLRNAPANASNLDLATARAQTESSRAELAVLITQMNELLRGISRNMSASAQLFSVTGPSATRTVRSVSGSRLALYGLLVILLSLPVIAIGCVMHDRVRDEEAAEQYLQGEGEHGRAR